MTASFAPNPLLVEEEELPNQDKTTARMPEIVVEEVAVEEYPDFAEVGRPDSQLMELKIPDISAESSVRNSPKAKKAI
jgi:hypothetical protein